MASMDELVDSVAGWVPEAPNPVIKQACRDIYYEFCRQSRVIRGEVFPTDTQPGRAELSLDVMTEGNTRVYDILSLEVDGKPIDPGDFHRAKRLGLRDKGRPKLFDFGLRETMMLYPTPDKVYEITGEVILVPRRSTDTIDNDVYDNYAYGLRHGVIFELAGTPNKPWSDASQAEMSAQYYRAELENAMDTAQKRNQSQIRKTAYGGL